MDTTKKLHLFRTFGYVCVILGLSAASGAIYASGAMQPPEVPLGGPASLFLVAVAAAIGVVAAVRTKWKK